MEPRNVIIIGSGPAGLTAAIYTARANLQPLMFEGLEWGGQLMITTDVENYPGFPDGILGPELMEKWRSQAKRFDTEIRSQNVTRVDFSERPFKVWVDDDLHLAKSIIISTGATARRIGIPNEAEYTGRGLSYCATCDGFFFRDQEIVVVGGGDSAVEEAIFLTKFGSKVTLVHRRDQLRASKVMQDRAFANPKIEFAWNTLPVAVEVDGMKSTGLRVRDKDSADERVIPAGGIFVAIGHDPATKIFEGQLDLQDNGYIVTKPGSTYTSVEGVFASGDCVDYVYRQAVTAAGMGCMSAIDAERWLEAQH